MVPGVRILTESCPKPPIVLVSLPLAHPQARSGFRQPSVPITEILLLYLFATEDVGGGFASRLDSAAAV
jgi:hypothetical protein